MDLTQEQEETLMNFQAIIENWDQDTALQLLIRNRWVMNDAINEYMAYTGQFNQIPVIQPQAPVYRPQASAYHPQVYFEEEELEARPTRFERSSITEARASNTSFLSKIKNTFGSVISSPIPMHSSSVDSFKSKLLKLTNGVCPEINTFLLPDAILLAKTSKKMLAIYLHPNEVPWDYAAHILSHDLTIDILNLHFIFWAVEKESPDASYVINLLRPQSFPCLAVINADHSQNVVLEKLEGTYSPEKIVTFLTRNYIIRPYVDPNQKRIMEERKIRERQERELREAEFLIVEKQKNEQRKKIEEERKKLEERKKEEEKNRENEKRIERVGPEPVGDDTCLVIFRMPDGSKVERRFAGSRNVEVLYDFVKTLGLDGFELLFGFPAGVLKDMGEVLRESALFPKAIVIVRMAED